MNISGQSDRSSEEWKERRSEDVGREVQGGMGSQICFFVDLINDIGAADFNQTALLFVIFIDFHLRLLSLRFPLPSCRYVILKVYDEPRKKAFKGWWDRLFCAPVGVRG